MTMGLIQRLGDLDGVIERLIERQRPLAIRAARFSPSRYSMTRKSGHRAANVIDRADMRVLRAATVRASRSKRSRYSGFPERLRGQHFDRDGAVETFVARAINLAHAARADGRENFVGSQMAARFNCHSVTKFN